MLQSKPRPQGRKGHTMARRKGRKGKGGRKHSRK